MFYVDERRRKEKKEKSIRPRRQEKAEQRNNNVLYKVKKKKKKGTRHKVPHKKPFDKICTNKKEEKGKKTMRGESEK